MKEEANPVRSAEEISAENQNQKDVDLFVDVCTIIDGTNVVVQRSVNAALVIRNWLLGQRIAEEELRGANRAGYGLEIIKDLAKRLTERYGKGFNATALYECRQFYRFFPGIFSTVSRESSGALVVGQSTDGKSDNGEEHPEGISAVASNTIVAAVNMACRESRLLSWSHYRLLLRIADPEARHWYEQEALHEGWSVRTLQRNTASQYYYRLLKSQVKQPVIDEMHAITAASNLPDKLEFIKNPVIAEFLGLEPNPSLRESTLEQAIITNLQKFLMELGKGYAFVGRQYRIQGLQGDYFVDLVFYNYDLRCFVLIDLKTAEITHQDVGQMDMYVRMFDEVQMKKGHNPTLGIVLCSETNADIARYSLLNGSDQLFAAKYRLYLPTDEELRAEIETQKAQFYWRQQEIEGGKRTMIRE